MCNTNLKNAPHNAGRSILVLPVFKKIYRLCYTRQKFLNMNDVAQMLMIVGVAATADTVAVFEAVSRRWRCVAASILGGDLLQFQSSLAQLHLLQLAGDHGDAGCLLLLTDHGSKSTTEGC